MQYIVVIYLGNFDIGLCHPLIVQCIHVCIMKVFKMMMMREKGEREERRMEKRNKGGGGRENSLASLREIGRRIKGKREDQ